jgi:hypothetical protein
MSPLIMVLKITVTFEVRCEGNSNRQIQKEVAIMGAY